VPSRNLAGEGDEIPGRVHGDWHNNRSALKKRPGQHKSGELIFRTGVAEAHMNQSENQST
jgi:hypothetical protein